MDPNPDPWRAALTAVAERSKPGGTLPAEARLVLHFHPESDLHGRPVLRRILEEGRYASQFVTGTSNGGLTAVPGGDRWHWESRLFGGAYDEHPSQLRPAYGALNLADDPYGAAPRFGSAYLRLRPEAIGRATFVYPDSAFQPELFGVADRLGLIDDFHADEPDELLNRYIEAQVHGGVSVPADVEAVVVDPSFDDDATLRIAEQAGIVVERHPGYRLDLAAVEANPEYRGEDTVEVARAIAVDGVLTPVVLGRARASGGYDPQLVKYVWHHLARFGREWPGDADA
ncbi:DUF3626 domain-containing protein [Agromyces endophyticus]|uniref:DUF3626 domain-containing protein n=1 Tax=Agromyces sp. H17E-10 TaxID=2932244 RepID=UPI001FD4C066|nr:DUF3626 domain-containing protein [Agromyces sp. H17E-10]UOQ89391.1 DUF3626 domain-containing protein [Agromyces sp. H17E-10]